MDCDCDDEMGMPCLCIEKMRDELNGIGIDPEKWHWMKVGYVYSRILNQDWWADRFIEDMGEGA